MGHWSKDENKEWVRRDASGAVIDAYLERRGYPKRETRPEDNETNKLLNERGSTHGNYADGARTIQGLKAFFHRHDGWQKLSDKQKESFDMFATKLGRILAGDANHKDSWIDISGYATLIVEDLK